MQTNTDRGNNPPESSVVAGFLTTLGQEERVFLDTSRLVCPVDNRYRYLSPSKTVALHN
jgi:hypothetical protein